MTGTASFRVSPKCPTKSSRRFGSGSGRSWQAPWFLNGMRWMSFTPFLAVLAGWVVTETGRAPWLIYGVMTHAQGLTPSLTGGMALFTLIGYMVVYAMVFSAGLYYLFRVLQAGLEEDLSAEDTHEVERASRPLSATHVRLEQG